jgi:alpha-amylase
MAAPVQQVMLQAFYKRGKFVAVPCPADHSGPVWWWDHLARQANDFAKAGFTKLWLPPVTKAAQGVSEAALGYSVFDDYDIGSKNQKASVHTRYGNREQLTRCVAACRANGIDVLVDLQLNHRRGGEGPEGMTFRYLDAFGRPGGGRFPKDPRHFHTIIPEPTPPGFQPATPQDPHVPLGQNEMRRSLHEYFGPDFAHVHSDPPNYVSDGLTDAVDWLTRSLDVQGYRIDHVPGLSTDFLHAFLDRKSLAGKYSVGEYFNGDRGVLRNWINDPAGMNGRCSAFDFALWGAFLRLSNRPDQFNMGDLDHAGLAGTDPFRAVTFVENHDTESRPDIIPQHVIKNKTLAYAYILTSEGLPCVFYKDYSTDPGCVGLKPKIDNLIWIRRFLADGETVQRWKDGGVFAYERVGGRRLLVALNKDEHSQRTITVDTGFGANVPLHEYTGHAGPLSTDNHGRATITIPRNAGGLGYVCYSLSGVNGTIVPEKFPVVQDFEGAADLDIRPADHQNPVTVGRIWAEAGEAVSITLRYDTTAWTANTRIILEAIDTTGHVVATREYSSDTTANAPLLFTPTVTGWHTLRIRSRNTPAGNENPAFTLTARYHSPQVVVDA